ncbi:MAG: NAD(P)H-binding protein [Tomitella sp.]|nr:NAD(P)H-binding protein [Tomitella sp.]
MADSERVVIVGGHGKIALMAAPKLKETGYTVDSVIRNPDQSADVEAAGAESVVLDIEKADVDALSEVFAGATAVVFAAGAGGGNPERTRAVDYEAATRAMKAAQEVGAKRFVMISYATAGVDVDRIDQDSSFYVYAKAKHDADADLRETELDFTILGPGMLTLESGTGKIAIADEDGKVDGRAVTRDEAATSRANVAEVIRHVIASGAATRQTVGFYDGDTPIAEAIR